MDLQPGVPGALGQKIVDDRIFLKGIGLILGEAGGSLEVQLLYWSLVGLFGQQFLDHYFQVCDLGA
jgi:hypothetical protein